METTKTFKPAPMMMVVGTRAACAAAAARLAPPVVLVGTEQDLLEVRGLRRHRRNLENRCRDLEAAAAAAEGRAFHAECRAKRAEQELAQLKERRVRAVALDAVTVREITRADARWVPCPPPCLTLWERIVLWFRSER